MRNTSCHSGSESHVSPLKALFSPAMRCWSTFLYLWESAEGFARGWTSSVMEGTSWSDPQDVLSGHPKQFLGPGMSVELAVVFMETLGQFGEETWETHSTVTCFTVLHPPC